MLRAAREVETGSGGGLIEAALDAVRDARPEQVLVGARNAAVQNDPPLLFVGRREAQALERDRHEQDVALAGEASFRVPHRVEGIDRSR